MKNLAFGILAFGIIQDIGFRDLGYRDLDRNPIWEPNLFKNQATFFDSFRG